MGFSPRIGPGKAPRRVATLDGSRAIRSFKRRYATRSLRPLIRGLKPTATVIWSLRDRACAQARTVAGMNGRNRDAVNGNKPEPEE